MDIRTPVPTIYGYFHQKFGQLWIDQVTKLKESFGDSIEKILMPVESMVDMPTLFIKKEKALDFLAELKNNYHYSFLTDFTATDLFSTFIK